MAHVAGRDISTVAIIDDCPLILFAMKVLAQQAYPHSAVAGYRCIESFKASLTAAPPQLAIVDLVFQHGSGLELIEHLHREHRHIRVLVYSCREESHFAQRSLRAGALGYLSKTRPAGEIIEALRRVGDGHRLEMPPHASGPDALADLDPAASSGNPVGSLSNRELEVLMHIGRGHSSRHIAAELCRSVKTIETYQWRIRTKLGLQDKQELLRFAYEHLEQLSAE